MNSLSDLNGVADAVLQYEDNRPTGVVFNKPVPRDIETITSTSTSFNVTATIGILEIINPAQAQVRYEINAGATSATLTWANLPQGVTVSQVGSVWTVSGITSQIEWEAVAEPTITVPNDFYGEYNYTATIIYNTDEQNNNEVSWSAGQYRPAVLMSATSTITTIGLKLRNAEAELTSSISMSVVASVLNFGADAGPFNWQSNSITDVTNAPTVGSSPSPTGEWTITISPSIFDGITNITSNGTGGTSTYNSTLKVLTLTGTMDEVNSHLNSIKIYFSQTVTKADFILTYIAEYENVQGEVEIDQVANCLDVQYLALPTVSTWGYDEDQAKTVPGPSLINDDEYDGSGTYTYTVSVTPTDALGELYLSSAQNGSSTSFANNVLTITGTRSQINGDIIRLTYNPAADYTTDFTMTYSVTTPRNDSNSHSVPVTNQFADEEVSPNIADPRAVLAGTNITKLFATNTPQITDVDTGESYTVTLTSNKGFFRRYSGDPATVGSGTTNRPWEFTGSKSEINAILPDLEFLKAQEMNNQDGTFSYQQEKSGAGVQAYVTDILIRRRIYNVTSRPNTILDVIHGFKFELTPVWELTYFRTEADIYFEIEWPSTAWAFEEPALPAGLTGTYPSSVSYRVSGFTTLSQAQSFANNVVYKFDTPDLESEVNMPDDPSIVNEETVPFNFPQRFSFVDVDGVRRVITPTQLDRVTVINHVDPNPNWPMTYDSNRWRAIAPPVLNTQSNYDSDTTYQYTVSVSRGWLVPKDSQSQFKQPDYSIMPTNSSFNTGTISVSASNDRLDILPTVYYYPEYNQVSNETATITVYHEEDIIFQETVPLDYSGVDGFNDVSPYWTVTNGVLYPRNYTRLYGKFDLLLVGGGGGSMTQWAGHGNAGSGGGGGEVVYVTNLPFDKSSYQISAGAGGQSRVNYSSGYTYTKAGDGGDSIFDTYTARGGKGAQAISDPYWDASVDPGKGGNSGNGFIGASGQLVADGSASGYTIYGGGGAGAGGDGGYSQSSYSPGGPGVMNNISGVNIEYGRGGDADRSSNDAPSIVPDRGWGAWAYEQSDPSNGHSGKVNLVVKLK